jgi:Ca-activated chloride channel family protein
MSNPPDYYALLNITRSASPEEVRRAYFDAARRFHPDRNTAPGDTEFFLGVQAAYEVLADPARRQKYDVSLPPEELQASPVRQKILYSRQSILKAGEPQLIYVLLEYAPPADPSALPIPPLNLCLIVDRSTSMRGRNMDIVKATAIQILRRLRPQDIFSVVAFSDRAEVILSSERNTELGKLEARIQMLQNSGGTEIYQGLETGFREVNRNADKGHVNHIILLTDGRTYGDEKNCLDLAQKAADKGIGISGLGIGYEWNDTFLDELASQTGGSSMYVSRPEDIQRLLIEKFNHLWHVYAEAASLEFETVTGVGLQYAFRLQPEIGLLPLESPIPLGPIPRDSPLKILMEFMVQPQAYQAGAVNLMEGKLTVQISTLPVPPPMVNLHLVRPVTDNSGMEPPPKEIVEALSHLTLYRLQERARLEVTAGEYDNAASHLQRLATHLSAQGEKQLAQTALLEADNIMKHQAFSMEGGKRIKYGTRALLLPGKVSTQ